MRAEYVLAGIVVLAIVGLLAVVLIPNRGIENPGQFTPRTDRGLLRNIIAGI